jgi:hypothetical protein
VIFSRAEAAGPLPRKRCGESAAAGRKRRTERDRRRDSECATARVAAAAAPWCVRAGASLERGRALPAATKLPVDVVVREEGRCTCRCQMGGPAGLVTLLWISFCNLHSGCTQVVVVRYGRLIFEIMLARLCAEAERS